MKDTHLYYLKGKNKMNFQKYYIIADTREQFENESNSTLRPYNDHPSAESICYLADCLHENGFNVEIFGGVEKLIEACYQKRQFQKTLFLNFSDGLVQKNRKAQSAILLEYLNVPYTGSDALSMLMAGNKIYAKKMVSPFITVPNDMLVFQNDTIALPPKFPIVIKPNREGSSLGISQENICTNSIELRERLPILLSKYQEIIIEEYIPGYEITCFIIGNKDNYYLVEPIICEYNGVRYFDDFVFGLEEKANHLRKESLARNILDTAQIEQICQAAKFAFEALNMRDFARVDFRLQKDGQLFFIEINGNPVISKTSEIGIISSELNIPYGKIVSNIIRVALKRMATNHA